MATPFSGSCRIDLCGHIDAIQALHQITRAALQPGHFKCRCNDDTGFLRSFSLANFNALGGSHFLRNKCSDFFDRARARALSPFRTVQSVPQLFADGAPPGV